MVEVVILSALLFYGEAGRFLLLFPSGPSAAAREQSVHPLPACVFALSMAYAHTTAVPASGRDVVSSSQFIRDFANTGVFLFGVS
jgi:hypothetical protein